MATAQSRRPPKEIEYPTSDGKPMAETEDHRELMIDTIRALQMHPPTANRFYVSGNLLMYYERGDKRKHVSPDVFAVEGLPTHRRLYYLVWVEGKPPDVVFELTSKSTKREDQTKKFELYRDVLRVTEYFLFDPHGDYLKPRLKGFRLVRGDYEPIQPRADGSLFSEVLGLILEVHGNVLRLRDPSTGELLPTPEEARHRAEAERARAETERFRAEAAQHAAEAALSRAEAEKEALRRELDELRRRKVGDSE